jgi:hypothetical protein
MHPTPDAWWPEPEAVCKWCQEQIYLPVSRVCFRTMDDREYCDASPWRWHDADVSGVRS